MAPIHIFCFANLIIINIFFVEEFSWIIKAEKDYKESVFKKKSVSKKEKKKNQTRNINEDLILTEAQHELHQWKRKGHGKSQ